MTEEELKAVPYLFQFLIVRLKYTCMVNGCRFNWVSIPYSTIKISTDVIRCVDWP